ILRENLHSFSLEISLDEGDMVTSPEAHFFVASELHRRKIDFQSLAPRFPGFFEKGVDYIGNIEEFAQSLRTHAVIQRNLGGYRLSLHSGSEKFSVYPIFVQETDGLFHIKTSGTSWLVALETIAEVNPDLFAQVYQVAYETFEENAKAYRISVKKEELPEAVSLKDGNISRLLSNPKIRQFLHVSYGSVLRSLGEELREALWREEDRHYNNVQKNIEKHMCALFGKDM
ncbi:MAG: tagaturonate epimerase family protein, partial [Candidatus Hadarchaeales archaeon]